MASYCYRIHFLYVFHHLQKTSEVAQKSPFELLISPALSKQGTILLEDLSYGLERYPIQVVSPNGSIIHPPEFGYIKESMVLVEEGGGGDLWRSVRKSFRPKAGCKGCGTDCLTTGNSACVCALQSGDFAYNTAGLLQADTIKDLDDKLTLEYCNKGTGCFCANLPIEDSSSGETSVCRGHQPRTFVTECNSMCACHLKCGNRVIQHGMTVKVQVSLVLF